MIPGDRDKQATSAALERHLARGALRIWLYNLITRGHNYQCTSLVAIANLGLGMRLETGLHSANLDGSAQNRPTPGQHSSSHLLGHSLWWSTAQVGQGLSMGCLSERPATAFIAVTVCQAVKGQARPAEQCIKRLGQAVGNY